MLEEMIAYMELHELSLLQDAEMLQNKLDNHNNLESDEYYEIEMADMNNTGEIWATRHLLSVARDILAKSNNEGE